MSCCYNSLCGNERVSGAAFLCDTSQTPALPRNSELEDEQPKALDEISRRVPPRPDADTIKQPEQVDEALNREVVRLVGIQESDTACARLHWDLNSDKRRRRSTS